jgi:hypothetical protein
MKIRITFEFTDEDRRALAKYYSEDGLASREDCRAYIVAHIAALMEDLPYDDDEDSD